MRLFSRMEREHARGATLIEVVATILTLGIAIPPLVGLFTEVSSNTVDDTYQRVALNYADALMEEIVSKQFEDPDAASGSFATEEGSRSAYDDLDDFDGLSNSPPQRIDGTALSDYGGLTRSVTVDNVTALAPDPATPETDGSTEFKRIRVTVAWTSGRGGEITLSTLRTKFAAAATATGPLDVTASAASAFKDNSDRFELNFVSNVGYDAVIESYELSASRTTPPIDRIRLSGDDIWRGSTSLPTGLQTLNEGTTSERTVTAGASPEGRFEFDDDISSGAITFTLILNFTDGSSSTIVFTLNW